MGNESDADRCRFFGILIGCIILWYFICVTIYTGAYFGAHIKTHNITNGCRINPPSCAKADLMQCYRNSMGNCFMMGGPMTMSSLAFVVVVMLFGPMFLAIYTLICCPKNQYMNDLVKKCGFNSDRNMSTQNDGDIENANSTEGNVNLENPTSSSSNTPS